MARREDITLEAVDGRPLGARRYEPSTLPFAQVVVHGATAVPQRFYDAWAMHLANRGVRVLTYDFRGIDRSRTVDVRVDSVTMRDWVDDASVAQRWLSDLDPDVPLVAVGHSFGGQIAAGLLPAADAIVLVGAQGGYVGRFPAPRRYELRAVMSLAIPGIAKLWGYVPGWTGLGEDLPPGVAREWARWCLSPEYFMGELPQMRAKLARWSGPMLALSFTDDDFASLENVQWLLDHFDSAELEHLRFAPHELGLSSIGHFGFFRPTASVRLWSVVDRFLARFGGPVVQPAPTTFAEAVLADLSYGRS
ncbi:MAG TPA: alpha/beta fold hydrolase [Nannocystaceae bacterium]|nr:alpha/beta fold hydrolase [Nannocystaceae bacterium]